MDKLSLPEILRYLVIGFVIIGVSYMCFPSKTGEIYTQLGPLGVPVLAFVLGSLTFFAYRSTIYSFVILRVMDWIHLNVKRQLEDSVGHCYVK